MEKKYSVVFTCSNVVTFHSLAECPSWLSIALPMGLPAVVRRAIETGEIDSVCGVERSKLVFTGRDDRRGDWTLEVTVKK